MGEVVEVRLESPVGVGATRSIVALVLAVFTVSVGYGVVLPLLPDLVGRLLPVGAAQARVSWHTGMLTAAYSLALFLAAPVWGLLSDTYGRRRVLLTALVGFGVATAAFSLVDTVAWVYLQRFLSGLFAAAADADRRRHHR